MAEPTKIRTHNKKGKVDIDGHIWSVHLPGAGTELRFSQASRACKLYMARIDIIDKKIESGTATEEDLDKYEEYSRKYEENEKLVLDIFTNTFRDDTKDNTDVRKWVEDTPSVFIMRAFEDVRDQSAESKEMKAKEDAPEQSS